MPTEAKPQAIPLDPLPQNDAYPRWDHFTMKGGMDMKQAANWNRDAKWKEIEKHVRMVKNQD